MLVSVSGDLGTGKTLLATYLAAGVGERPLYANYKLNLPMFHELHPETLLELKPKALVILDEAYSWLESRTSGRAINRYAGYIMLQARKRNIEIIITEQMVGTVDLRFRFMVNWDITCDIHENGFIYEIEKKSRKKAYKPKKYILPMKLAELVFPLYDTDETIDAFDEDMLLTVTSDKTVLFKQVDEIVKILLKLAPPEKYTKAIVKAYIERNNLPKQLSDYVYNAIKFSTIMDSREEQEIDE